MSVINSYSSANKIKKRFTAKEINDKNLHKGKMVAFCPYADFVPVWLTVRFYRLLAYRQQVGHNEAAASHKDEVARGAVLSRSLQCGLYGGVAVTLEPILRSLCL